MKKIVSRNYRDYGSDYKWLVRNEGSPAESARACKRVVAKGVKFQKTGGEGLEVEIGFGCRVVAMCDEAIAEDMEPIFEKLTFEYDRFELSGKIVTEVSEMHLEPDGSVLALV